MCWKDLVGSRSIREGGAGLPWEARQVAQVDLQTSQPEPRISRDSRVRSATEPGRRDEHPGTGDGLGSVGVALDYAEQRQELSACFYFSIGKDDLLGCCVLGKDSPTVEGRTQWENCFLSLAQTDVNGQVCKLLPFHLANPRLCWAVMQLVHFRNGSRSASGTAFCRKFLNNSATFRKPRSSSVMIDIAETE